MGILIEISKFMLGIIYKNVFIMDCLVLWFEHFNSTSRRTCFKVVVYGIEVILTFVSMNLIFFQVILVM
jgi:hypothetical protein